RLEDGGRAQASDGHRGSETGECPAHPTVTPPPIVIPALSRDPVHSALGPRPQRLPKSPPSPLVGEGPGMREVLRLRHRKSRKRRAYLAPGQARGDTVVLRQGTASPPALNTLHHQ